jgi:hypothetical protein
LVCKDNIFCRKAKDSDEKFADSTKNHQSIIISLIFFVPLPPLINKKGKNNENKERRKQRCAPENLDAENVDEELGMGYSGKRHLPFVGDRRQGIRGT